MLETVKTHTILAEPGTFAICRNNRNSPPSEYWIEKVIGYFIEAIYSQISDMEQADLWYRPITIPYEIEEADGNVIGDAFFIGTLESCKEHLKSQQVTKVKK